MCRSVFCSEVMIRTAVRWLALVTCCGTSALAQTRPTPSVVFHVAGHSGELAEPNSFGLGLVDNPKSQKAPLLAPLASLALPGSGQGLMRQQRAVGYLVLEGFLALQAVRTQREVNQARANFRSIAANVARASFATVRPNGPWDYYETLEEFSASGSYDLAVAGKFTPETDETTYNGLRWLQARQTYWANAETAPAQSSPEYQRAISYYQSHAVQGSFRWTWRDHQLEQAAYIQTIKEANRTKQRYVSEIGVIAANHLISMIDAYITLRVRRFGGAGLGASLKLELQPVGDPRLRQYGSVLKLTVPLPAALR